MILGALHSAAYWTQTRLLEDTRIKAHATSRSRYLFAAPEGDGVKVEAKLIFRRAYYELMQQKGWDTPDILMQSVSIRVPAR